MKKIRLWLQMAGLISMPGYLKIKNAQSFLISLNLSSVVTTIFFYQPSPDALDKVSDKALIDSIDDFKKYSLGVTRGSFHENYMREHYPEFKLAAI